MAESIMEKVRRFAGADPAVPDTVLEMCYLAAVEWYKAAGVEKDEENDLWVFWVSNLAAWMYDNRGNAEAGAAIPVYIVTSVHQLRKGYAESLEAPADDEPAAGEEAGGGATENNGAEATNSGSEETETQATETVPGGDGE